MELIILKLDIDWKNSHNIKNIIYVITIELFSISFLKIMEYINIKTKNIKKYKAVVKYVIGIMTINNIDIILDRVSNRL